MYPSQRRQWRWTEAFQFEGWFLNFSQMLTVQTRLQLNIRKMPPFFCTFSFKATSYTQQTEKNIPGQCNRSDSDPEFPFTCPPHTLWWTCWTFDFEQYHCCPPHQVLNLFLLPVTERGGVYYHVQQYFLVQSLCTYRMIQLLWHILQTQRAAASLQHNSCIVSNYPNGVGSLYFSVNIYTDKLQRLWAALQLYAWKFNWQSNYSKPSICIVSSLCMAACIHQLW